MAGFRDMFQRSWGERSPEEVVLVFKEKLHEALNQFKNDPTSQERLKKMLQAIKLPLAYFNQFMVRPRLEDSAKLKELAQQYGIRKSELKRMLKATLELEDTLNKYFGKHIEVDQFIITLRRLVNTLDEKVFGDVFDAFDRNIEYSKIEKAYLNYQEAINKYFDAPGLNRDLKHLFEQFVGNVKESVHSAPHTNRNSPSASHPEIRMLDIEFQKIYDHYRDEGYQHEEALLFVQERQELALLSEELLEAYRVLRQEGQNHAEAIQYVYNLKGKISG